MVNETIGKAEQEFFNTKFEEAFQIKKHWTSAPTYTPTNFFEQIVFYDDEAGTRRVYFYLNGSWSYVALT